MRFDWDTVKAKSNQSKHGVSFEEAKTVFLDADARIISDPEHSGDEDRFVLLGMSHKLRLLLVCHCYRGDDDVIRIISARKSTKREAKTYREYLP